MITAVREQRLPYLAQQGLGLSSGVIVHPCPRRAPEDQAVSRRRTMQARI